MKSSRKTNRQIPICLPKLYQYSQNIPRSSDDYYGLLNPNTINDYSAIKISPSTIMATLAEIALRILLSVISPS